MEETTEEIVFWDRFLDLVAQGRVVPIIGRDLLTVQYQGTAVTLLKILAERLAEKLEVSKDELPEGDELHTVACRYMKKGNSIEDVYPVIASEMDKNAEIKGLSIPPPFGKLAAIPNFKLFVTTTFDSFLERAINQVRFNGEAKTRILSFTPKDTEDLPPVSLEKLDYPIVFHLLGKLGGGPAFAVTHEDILEYLLALTSKSEQLKNLFDVMRNASLLILGCSFGEWLARFFIRTAKCQPLSKGGPDFVADKRISSDSNLLVFLKDFSGARTKIYPKGGALEFIDELHRRWTELYPSAPPDPKTIIDPSYVRPGAVFLSYASQDRGAAAGIKEALAAAGVDVFFDKEDLYAGEAWKPKLKRSISQASLFIALISKNTLPTPETRYFRREWAQAADEAEGKPETVSFIIPVLIDETPLAAVEPPEKFFIPQWETLPGGQPHGRFVEQVKQLYRRYKKMVEVL